MKSRVLHHFTSVAHLAMIEASGTLLPTESNVGSPVPDHHPYGTHVGPDVVWLLDTGDPGDGVQHGLSHDVVNKRGVHLTVDVPAIRWLDWLPARQMDPRWRDVFTQAGGGVEMAGHWYVWPASIRRERWLSVEILAP